MRKKMIKTITLSLLLCTFFSFNVFASQVETGVNSEDSGSTNTTTETNNTSLDESGSNGLGGVDVIFEESADASTTISQYFINVKANIIGLDKKYITDYIDESEKPFNITYTFTNLKDEGVEPFDVVLTEANDYAEAHLIVSGTYKVTQSVNGEYKSVISEEMIFKDVLMSSERKDYSFDVDLSKIIENNNILFTTLRDNLPILSILFILVIIYLVVKKINKKKNEDSRQ